MQYWRYLWRSHKGLLFGLVLVFAITISAAYFLLRQKSTNKAPLLAVKQAPKDSPLLQDEDRDGLLSWEEDLYRTDPQNADTDNDGIPDGEEVKIGANPIDPTNSGPALGELEKSAMPGSRPSSNLTRSFFDDFVKEGGGELLLGQRNSDAAAKLLSQKLAQYAERDDLSVRPAIIPESILIKRTAETGTQAVKNYLNALTAIFETHLEPLKEDDLSIFQRALITADPALTANLKQYRQAVEQATRAIRTLEVPENLVWLHIKEIQLFEETWRGLLAMERLEQDPLSALAAIPGRKEVKLDILKLHYQELKSWLGENGIALTVNEKAYRLVN